TSHVLRLTSHVLRLTSHVLSSTSPVLSSTSQVEPEVLPIEKAYATVNRTGGGLQVEARALKAAVSMIESMPAPHNKRLSSF
ncbi:MAG: hypothetical protein WCL19_01135, partial [Verrucomicrobiota bacterium]